MGAGQRVLLVFIDGLGIGSTDSRINPLCSGAAPTLVDLLQTHSVPLDANLGLAGLPQSATGQTTLLTGVNAAEAVGRHVEGFPNAALREIIRAENIFRKLIDRGKTATFANAYYVDDIEAVRSAPLRSVTTVAALSGLGTIRDRHALESNEAVYQDLTRQALRERGYKGEVVSSQAAAQHLVEIADRHDFTLFEYFQTDRAGHTTELNIIRPVLTLLDRFVSALLRPALDAGLLVVLVSDHGNIEDISVRGHTRNPVPFIAVGKGAEQVQAGATSLVDVTPALIRAIAS